MRNAHCFLAGSSSRETSDQSPVGGLAPAGASSAYHGPCAVPVAAIDSYLAAYRASVPTAAFAALDPAHVAAALRDGRRLAVTVAGRSHSLEPQDVLLALAPIEGYSLEREGSHAVALELAIDEGLHREGLAREVVHAVQGARRAAELEITDRIALDLRGDQSLVEAARAHAAYIAGETLATTMTFAERELERAETTTIEGRPLEIRLERASSPPGRARARPRSAS